MMTTLDIMHIYNFLILSIYKNFITAAFHYRRLSINDAISIRVGW